MRDFLSRRDKTPGKCWSSHVSPNRGYSSSIFDNIIDVCRLIWIKFGSVSISFFSPSVLTCHRHTTSWHIIVFMEARSWRGAEDELNASKKGKRLDGWCGWLLWENTKDNCHPPSLLPASAALIFCVCVSSLGESWMAVVSVENRSSVMNILHRSTPAHTPQTRHVEDRQTDTDTHPLSQAFMRNPIKTVTAVSLPSHQKLHESSLCLRTVLNLWSDAPIGDVSIFILHAYHVLCVLQAESSFLSLLPFASAW